MVQVGDIHKEDIFVDANLDLSDEIRRLDMTRIHSWSLALGDRLAVSLATHQSSYGTNKKWMLKEKNNTFLIFVLK